SAVAFWKNLLDNVFDSLNVDGWKVDESDYLLRGYNYISTFAGDKTPTEYSKAYYTTIYNYTIERRGNNGMIMARPYCDQHPTPYWYAPLSVNTAGWVGDQNHSWDGLQHALLNIFISANAGYASLGFDISGYTHESDVPPNKTLFLRWTQFGSLVPIMENGGTTNSYHQPWLFDENAVQVYRYFASLHHELVPYLYSYNILAHLTRTPIIRSIGSRGAPPDTNSWVGDWKYLLGDNFFVAPIYQESNSRTITFPAGSWINYWNESDIHEGGTTAALNYPIEQYPIFIRSGAIIPMNVNNSFTAHGSDSSKKYLTLLIYPNGTSSYEYYTDESTSTLIKCVESANGFTISFSKNTGLVIIRLKNNIEPESVSLNGTINLTQKYSFADFETSPSGWFHGKISDENNIYTWIKFSNLVDTIYVSNNCPLDLHPNNYETSFLNEGSKYYVDRAYTITSMPNNYRNFNMIKTANDDKKTINLDFYFNLCKSAEVYIAYDNRLTPPQWLANNYQNTNEKIYVSDPFLNYFNIWKRTTQPGTITFYDNGGVDNSGMYFVFYNLYQTFYLDTKVFLEAAYTGGNNMNTTLLQNNLIPKSQPYNTSPWNYAGAETVTEIPPNVVDWVLIELRNSTEEKTNIKRAGFLISNGTIVDLDGTSKLAFYNIPKGNYNIVIYHRNHLPIMSSVQIHLE
ncbi:MAG: hypothetical protein KDC90_14860, partial [Ignavibacteriae bacterium]|nr:hypothetical protein [Ignavibacteriota bacterium]